ncbi:aspartyl-phosphate phosphatase Spo0E family protein [Sutcliffiella horikoshii]|nr:aspartyl-phosphate phosphatase Spo0E family protein [Sutcliffiella horikoshii]
MMKIKLVELAVEKKRDQMVKTAIKTGLTSVETVRLSQELDEMLNVFIPPKLEEQKINQAKNMKKI